MTTGSNGAGVNGQSAVRPVFARLPRHVAIIMDGNGRWAQGRGLARGDGHRAGAQAVRATVEESRALGIKYLTLFSFSTENWNRPSGEVSGLMALLEHHLVHERELMRKNGIRLRAIGDLDRLPETTRVALAEVAEETAGRTEMELILAVSYGGRDEIVNAARKIARKVNAGELSADQITESVFANNLYAPDVPDPDLLIRTSDEHRISNFMLWQLAYSEIVMTGVLWPDFDRKEYHRCLSEYAQRERRFGLTSEQLAVSAQAER